MSAKVVVFAGEKGGGGKTTLAVHTAGMFAREGLKTLLVDTDPQGTARRWVALASGGKPFPAPIVGLAAASGAVHLELRKHLDTYDRIVVDTPPAVESPTPQSALLVADLAVIPVAPSPPDLWAAVGIRDLLTRVSSINEGLRAALVLNMCARTAVARDVEEILTDFGVPLTEARISRRAAFVEASAAGGVVHDLGSRAAAAIVEIDALHAELSAILGGANVEVTPSRAAG